MRNYFLFCRKKQRTNAKSERSKCRVLAIYIYTNVRNDWCQIETVRVEIGPILGQIFAGMAYYSSIDAKSPQRGEGLGRVHIDNFTRRAYRSRTVRERFAAGCPCTHCVHCVGFVRYTETKSVGVRSGRERFAAAWLCSVNARVDASDASGRE